MKQFKNFFAVLLLSEVGKTGSGRLALNPEAIATFETAKEATEFIGKQEGGSYVMMPGATIVAEAEAEPTGEAAPTGEEPKGEGGEEAPTGEEPKEEEDEAAPKFPTMGADNFPQAQL